MKNKSNLKYVIIIGTLLVDLVIISFMLYGIVLLNQSNNIENLKLFSFDFAVSVIGIAVTTWLGLNIYNVIEKNELKELERELNKSKKQLDQKIIEVYNKSDSFSQEINQISKDQIEIKNNLFQQRIELLKNSFNVKNTWFKLFYSFCENEKKELFETYGFFIRIEQLYNEVYRLNEQGESNDIHYYCEEGLRLISTAKSMINHDLERNNWFIAYLPIRESDFYYFSGLQYKREGALDRFKTNINFELRILLNIDAKIQDKIITIKDPICLAKHYNTIAISCIYLMNLNDSDSKDNERMAFEYSKKSIDTNYANAKSTRNYGTLLERKGQFQEAREKYLEALKKDRFDYNSYYCLGSLEIKLIKNSLINEENGKYIFKVDLLEESQLIDIRRKLHKGLINLQMGLAYAQDKIKFFNKIGLCYSYLALVEVEDERNKCIQSAYNYFYMSDPSQTYTNQMNLSRLERIQQYIKN